MLGLALGGLTWTSNLSFNFGGRGSPSSFLRYEQLNPKYRVFLLGSPVAKVTYNITIMITSCLEMIIFSYGTITLLIRDTML